MSNLSGSGNLSGVLAGGRPAVLEPLNITENGTYRPTGGVDGFNQVIAEIFPPLESLSVTENGTYTPSSGKYGFEEVTVNIPIPSELTLNVTENGTYTAPSGSLYKNVNVNCPAPPAIILNADNIQIATSEGHYLPQQPLTNNITDGGFYIVSLKQGDNIWNSIIEYDGVSDVTKSVNYGGRYFDLHLTPTTIGSQAYGGDYTDVYVKLSKIYIDSSQIY